MPDWIIKVEGLGKKYRIRHQQRERYTALRDVLANKTKGLLRRLSTFRPSAPEAFSASDFSVSEDFWALKDVSFEVKPGEVVGIIGRNGAGKSTLLKVLSQITEPTEGRVRLRGRVASLLEVGTGFHPELTGRENIYLNGAILGMTRAEIRRKFDEIVAFAEVEKFLDTPVKRYSSGMYVRLAFAVAAHLEPEILIVDEVLAVGDSQFQKKCLGKMHSVSSQEGRTVLLVSHNMAAISSLCRTALVLESGSVGFQGDVTGGISCYNKSLAQPTDRRRKSGPHVQAVSVDQDQLVLGNLTVHVDFDSPSPLKPLLIGAVVYASHGEPVFGFNSWMDPSFNTAPIQRGCATLRIPDLPLHPGQYRVAIWLGEGDQNFDHLPDAAYFEFSSSQPLPRGLSTQIIGSTKVGGTWTLTAN